jgi:DNA repair protein RecO (recombination protein O)
MNWDDDAIVLALKPHGETSAVAELLTRSHGRHLGLVRGGRRLAAMLQPGNSLRARWRARLADHLGYYTLEPLRLRTAQLLDSADALMALRAVSSLIAASLPERDPHPALYEGLTILLDHLDEPALWPALYVRFEVGLLEALGFGLALDRCAVTGSREDLAFVSPKSGRAVNREAAGPYADKLLRLPPFLLGAQAGALPGDVADGLKLTGYFLEHRVFLPHHKALPAARIALAESCPASNALWTIARCAPKMPP